jgi:polyribonucleotide nucleotidyltransferase
MTHTVEIDLHGTKITLETGKLAKQANGAVIVRSGDSVVLVSACANEQPKLGASFFPLTVDYREYTYAAGKYPGGFIKREGRPSEKEVLTSRLIDRPIRPLFPEGFSNETQVIAMVLSADPQNDPAPLAIVGAGAALAISDIPFHHILAGVRVGLVNGAFVPNPTYDETHNGNLNIMVAGSDAGIVMVEAGASEVSEEQVVEAIEFGHDCCKKIVAGIRQLVEKAGKPKWAYEPAKPNAEIAKKIADFIRVELTDALDTKKYQKLDSYHRVHDAKKKSVALFAEEEQEEAGKLFDALKEQIFRDEMLKARRRPDGRKFDELRYIWCEAGVLPRTHGSAIFTRGETQALVTATLGTKDDEQRIEMFDPSQTSKRFMLHYNFLRLALEKLGLCAVPGAARLGMAHLPNALSQP